MMGSRLGCLTIDRVPWAKADITCLDDANWRLLHNNTLSPITHYVESLRGDIAKRTKNEYQMSL